MAEAKIDSDWYLREWMKSLGRRQADMIRDLGWEKPRASKVYNSRTSYRREVVNELAAWLGIRPYELLMPPGEAQALARLRATAAEIVADKTAAADDFIPQRPVVKNARGRR